MEDHAIRTVKIIVDDWRPTRIMVLRNRFRFYRWTFVRECKLAELTTGWRCSIKEHDLGSFDWIARR